MPDAESSTWVKSAWKWYSSGAWLSSGTSADLAACVCSEPSDMRAARAGGSKSRQERKDARKARRKADGADGGADAGRQPTAEELAAAGARLGPRAKAEAAAACGVAPRAR